MNLKDILENINLAHKQANTSMPFICGGVVRDKVLGRVDQIADLDMTTGDASVHVLAKQFATIISQKYKIVFKKMTDGHASVFIDDFKVDFSSNFVVPNIDVILKNKFGISDAPSIQKELYSRDFTCNALLMTLDLKTIYDPTQKAVSDIKNKILKTCLDVDTTLRSSPNRIIRAIELSAKLDFDVDPEIIQWIANNKDVVKECEVSYVSKNLSKAVKYNEARTESLLNKTNLWDHITITQDLYPIYKKRAVYGT